MFFYNSFDCTCEFVCQFCSAAIYALQLKINVEIIIRYNDNNIANIFLIKGATK